MAQTGENEESPKLPCGPQRQDLYPLPSEYQDTAKRAIVIQLTGTEGEWDSLEDSELIFTLDRDGEGSLQKERSGPPELQPDEEWGLRSPVFHVPLSPSSPGSLGDCSTSGSGLLSPGVASPTHRPLASLVKSLSTELELKESSSSLKPRPLLNLVKSISTELSRCEPEVSQSKSDSKLSLHLWTQLTQPKGRNGDSRTAPPSPTNLSPSETKAGFFKMELEDTRRKLSEAMQEPLSMFNKIMREDSTGSPKHHRTTGSVDSPSFKGFGGSGVKSNNDPQVTESPMKTTKKLECEGLPVCNWPVRHPRKCLRRSCPSHDQHSRQLDISPALEINTNGDAMQVVEVKGGFAGDHTPGQASFPVPGMTLFWVAAASYCYFVLPLPSYWSGWFFGLALGFMLGLLLIRLGSTHHASQSQRRIENLYSCAQCNINGEEHFLKGWMNEMSAYDPETFQPSLMQSVHATLEGSCLRLDYPRNNIQRWATFDEAPHETIFVHSRTFQLSGSKVFLLPAALARKRVWNKKYPICITLAEGEEVVGRKEPEAPTETQKEDRSTLPMSKASHHTTLYLFGRTGREKEEWFYHLLYASKQKKEDQCESRSGKKVVCYTWKSSDNVLTSGSSSRASIEDMASVPLCPRDLVGRVRENILLDYTTYMSNLITSAYTSAPHNPYHCSAQSSPTDKEQPLCCHGDQRQPVWINALIGRIFWDFLREKYWADVVSHKIQRKLTKIRLPYFMNELTLTELAMGSCMPQITGTSPPQVNGRGLWLQLEIEYTGALQMSLETKMNLSKLGKEGGLDADSNVDTSSVRTRSRLSVLADSDEESSSAGSSDEEEIPSTELQGIVGEKSAQVGVEGATGGGRTGRRILRFVDKIAKSKYFQKATENEYIKKKIEEMSNTPLLLTVEVQELSGTLVINIPPPPTDRIWYSFCVPPKLDLRVRPKLGEREVTFCHVTEWIEKKLQDEFQDVFVFPNMDDIYLPLMNSGMDNLHTSPAQPSCSSSLNASEGSTKNHTAEIE
ncbi:testis-expressed protein 2 [Chanos chanos]|uniref:Testis-expressed protein 2 n=1 Tax=Chanos chanos TaxID=29144 RepID=A0A6J2VF47_CHACN|nr:testis-expressed protein 2-like [Chanos chanos]